LNPGRIVPLHLLFGFVQLESWGWPIPEATAATKPIQPTGGQESPQPQQDIQSQQFKPSTTPDPMAIFAFASFYLLRWSQHQFDQAGGRQLARSAQNMQS